MELNHDHGHQLADVDAARTFMFAGKAYLTLVSKATGTRFTYRVSTKEDAPFFVGVLSGPDNTHDYTYLGFVPQGGAELVAGKKGRPDAPSYKAFAWFLQALQAGVMPTQLEVWHEGLCGRCGRALTVPESIAAGLGPDCASKMQ